MSKTIETITETEETLIFRELFNQTVSPNRYSKRLRNATMIALMLDAGLRVGEVVRMQVTDLCRLNEPVHTLIIGANISKNKTGRSIPLTSRVRALVAEMNEDTWKYETRQDVNWCFFCWTPTNQITTRQVENIIKAISKIAINREINPHVLRHTFATRLMRTSNIRIVQALLGHKSLTSTQIYTHPNNIDLKGAIASLEKGKLPRN